MLDPKLYNKGPNEGDPGKTIYKDPLDLNPDLRRSKCQYCSNTAISDENLPFFATKRGETVDAYYCGCHGWD